MAIVGMGCRWAGGVKDVRGLWELLINKKDTYQNWAAPRFSAEGWYHPNPERPGTTAAKGGYVCEDPRLFDPSFFGISGLEAETIDASQRKLLEVVYEAFESAGDSWESINGTRTGVYVADISYDNSYVQQRDWEFARPHATTGLSNRINYIFNLRGPSVTLDSACTSALYGLHMAIQAIRNGDCDSAIVASSNWILDPTMQIAMDKLGALSATSMSHAFDISADGYARGEGFAAIYLKKAGKAMQDGSPIRVLVRGSAIGANGRSSGITHPSGPAQEDIIRKAYENAGLKPSDTPFLECHGTGTRVGDPLEVAAAGNVFGPGRADDDPLLVGSVKTILGHTEGAAALAGIFKAILALEAGVIPPSRGVETLNPKIDFVKAKATVVTKVTPWPVGKPLRASVTSAGFGGSLGHCILDHVNEVYPDYVAPAIHRTNGLDQSISHHHENGHTNGHANGHINGHANGHANGHTNGHANGHTNGHANGHTNGHANGHANGTTSSSQNRYRNGSSAVAHRPVVSTPEKTGKADAGTRQLVLLPFSAHNKSSLQANISALSQVISQYSLANIAYTLADRRSKLTQRTFHIVDRNDVTKGLLGDLQKVSSSPSEVPRLGYVFTGQGAQWHAMGAQLFEYCIFRSAIEHLDYVLSTLPKAPSWTITEILSGNCSKDRIGTPEISQTVCTAVQIGLVDLLASWSVYPSGVVGHSSGEMAAAYAAGRVTAAESIATAYFRGQTVLRNKQKGAMLAVGLGLEQVEKYLGGIEQHVTVAAINSPGSVTLSGEQAAVETLSKTLDSEGVFNRLLKTGGNAYHSRHMVALGEEYDTLLEGGLAHLSKLGLRDVRHRYPHIPWVSSVTPDKSLISESVAPSYWRSNLESPVRFSDAAANLVTREDIAIAALVEIGPHAALKSPLDQILKSINKTIPYAGTLKRGEDSRTSMLQLAGMLFSMNAKIDLAAVNAIDEKYGAKHALTHGVTAIDLPPYQYTYGPISYYESRQSKEFRLRRVPRHDLLGSKIAGGAKLRPQFRNVLRMKDLPWLADHRLLPDAVFPAAGYISMAIIAASQMYDEFPDAQSVEAFSLRNVEIKTALKIPEDQHGIEVILSMELVDSATARAPAWTSFSISSIDRDSETWTEHCTGLIKPDVVANPIKVDKISTNTEDRAISTRKWYKKFAEMGLGYGPTFQALSEIRADPAKNLASAKLGLKTTAATVKGGESAYVIHPASLDAMIQLGLLACHGGQIDRATTAFVPIHMSQLNVRTGNGQHWGLAAAHGEFRGLRAAYLQLQLQSQSGEVLLDIKDLRCISYSLEDQPQVSGRTKAFASPFTRSVYKPDFRTLSKTQAQLLFSPPVENVAQVPLLKILETIAALIAVDVYETFGGSGSSEANTPEATGHYIAWIKRLVESRTDRVVEASQLSPPRRRQMLQALYQETSHLVETKAMQRLHQNMADIARNLTTGEDVLAEGGLLADFYTDSLFLTGVQPQLTRLFDSMSHASPNLRILELKGGRGDITHLILETLSGTNGIKRYRDYTVTDVSENALKLARERLVAHRDVSFSTLDIEQDPLQQGYQPVYDVVLASQKVHTASSVSKALENALKLLKPGGKLVLVEATGDSAWVGLIGGAQAGYWHGVPDGRTKSPFLRVGEWDQALHAAGFSGTELMLDDYPSPTTHSTVLVSTAIEKQRVTNMASAEIVWLLHGAKGAPALLNQLARELEGRGLQAKMLSLDRSLHDVPTNARVIAFLDGENLLLDANQRHLEIFQHLAHHTVSMVCLTSTGMAQGRSPDGAIVGGLLRIISTEAPTGRFVSIDIDADDFNIVSKDEVTEFVRVISDQEQALQQESDGESNEDREFAWQSGCLNVSRLVPEAGLGYAERLTTPSTHGTELLPLDSQGPVRAAFETPGILSSLYFRPYTEILQQPLPNDFIEVKVAAVGLNWKDVALSTGRFDADNLSSEYSGVVTGVGSDAASRFAVGDGVFGLGKGHFGNYVRVPAAFAQKTRPEDDLVGLATLPIVLMTAVYAFEYLARLRSGQKVLIQSASGGLGIGAIQLARAKGADVFAMAGSQDKVRFLVDEVGLPSSNVFMGRGAAALSRALKATGRNNGFDVVLSTSQGDMLYETVKALAPLGHLIDVGRLDVMDARAIGLELFQKGATFSSFDLYRVVDCDPQLGQDIMQSVGDHYRAGRITPIRPHAVSDISKLDQTLLSFSRGTHLGKLVVTFKPNSMVRMVAPPPAATFDPEACYIITGGLSGLGRSIIQWMGERGARDIVVLSRRGARAPEAQTLVDTMAERGMRLEPVACDLTSREQVTQAINEASARRPVKGVVHCAVSYRDISFNKLSLEGWRDGLAAKVSGTRNLHEATIAMPLDFFVMTTSLLSVLGFATQGAYTAANNFQDQFARYRHRLGLPATAAQFGLINDIGRLSTDKIALDMMDRNKVLTVPESYFLRLLEPAFLNHDNAKAAMQCSGATIDSLAAAGYVTCVDPAHMATKEREDAELGLPSGAPPRWHSDARVSHIMQALDDALRHANSDGDTSGPSGGDDSRSAITRLRRDFDDAVQKTRAAPAGPEQIEQRGRAVDLVTAALKNTIGAMLLMDESMIFANRSVSDHGVDSLIATEFRNWLLQGLGSKISMVDLLDARTTISVLAAQVVDLAVGVKE
ncbi:polyketide synthase [Ophiobolus disseminans]|uniref:Polyketide synthase n=1 Tax=Ophiobolus disseminans TaxID=1469910 RepID=A0A6A7A0E5_9PLEO|nr:polyketide synthase [Ophiobolus disseminans]